MRPEGGYIFELESESEWMDSKRDTRKRARGTGIEMVAGIEK